MWYEHGVDAALGIGEYEPRLVCGHADDGGEADSVGGSDEGVTGLDADGAVLAVEENPVEAEQSEVLDRLLADERRDDTDEHLA